MQFFKKRSLKSFSLVLRVDPTCKPYNIEEILAEKYLFIQNTTVACYPLVEVYSLNVLLSYVLCISPPICKEEGRLASVVIVTSVYHSVPRSSV